MIPCLCKPCDCILQVLKRDKIATQKIKCVVSTLPSLILHILKNQFQREKEICKNIRIECADLVPNSGMLSAHIFPKCDLSQNNQFSRTTLIDMFPNLPHCEFFISNNLNFVPNDFERHLMPLSGEYYIYART